MHGPNPCVAPIKDGPFYAIKLVIGDLDTYAGIRTDAQARALDADGHPIPGLYAAGNDMASIMGGNYPGAGITLGAGAEVRLCRGEALGRGDIHRCDGCNARYRELKFDQAQTPFLAWNRT
jgi:predicted oxidoreductase